MSMQRGMYTLRYHLMIDTQVIFARIMEEECIQQSVSLDKVLFKNETTFISYIHI